MNQTPLALARTFLFVPANRPERFAKALASGADVVILDLEDAVPHAEKEQARQAIENAWAVLCTHTTPIVVRTNAWGSAHVAADLDLVLKLYGLAGVMLPKVESAQQLVELKQATNGVPVLPLIESAAGYLALSGISAAPAVVRLVVGHIDFMADTGLQTGSDEVELLPLRFAVAMHSRAQGLASAVDGVTVAVGDPARLTQDTHRAVRLGFGGKLCIHPQQIQGVHAAMRPSPEALAWAQKVIDADQASGGSAVQLEGRMVDAPVVLQARRTLAMNRAD
jgi:citrate lyase subunit beta / citryl-CoA lyase